MTKIKSINPNQLYIAQNAEVLLKLAGNTAQVTFTAGKKCSIKKNFANEFADFNLSTAVMTCDEGNVLTLSCIDDKIIINHRLETIAGGNHES